MATLSDLRKASSTKTGLLTNDAQTITGTKTFGTPLNSTILSGYSQSGEAGPLSLGVGVYQGTAGGIALVLCSNNSGAGNAVTSAFYLIRFYYSNSNTWPGDASTCIYLGGNGAGASVVTGNLWSFSKDGSDVLQVTGPAGNNQYKVIINKLL